MVRPTQAILAEKKELALPLIATGKLSIHAIAKVVGVNEKTVRKWFPEYLRPSQEDFRKKLATSLVSDGELSLRAIGESVGVHPWTIREWFPDYRYSTRQPANEESQSAREYKKKITAAILMKKNNMSVYEISRAINSRESTVRRWFPKYRPI